MEANVRLFLFIEKNLRKQIKIFKYLFINY